MAPTDPRTALAMLAADKKVSLSALSRMLGRNVAYLQQYVRRGTPRRLEDEDRQRLATFFGVDEGLLRGVATAPAAVAWRVPRLDVVAAAGPGALVDAEVVLGSDLIDPALARRLGLTRGQAAMIRVRGSSMEPGLIDGDQILVDLSSRVPGARGAVFVIRIGDALMVKRVRSGTEDLEVSSDNPAATPVPAGSVAVIGRVVWQMRAVA